MAFDGRVISNVGVLVAIVEGGSFARAAEALGLSRSGVSRAVSRLEARVGVQLIDRTTRVLALTDEGRRFYSDVAPLLSGIDEAVTATSGLAVAVRGRLRVNVDAFFSRLLLAPYLGDFLKLYPGLTLDIVAKDQLGDLISDGFDLAIRFGAPSELLAGRPKAVGDAHHHGGVSRICQTARPSEKPHRPARPCLHPGPGLVDWPAHRRMAVSAG